MDSGRYEGSYFTTCLARFPQTLGDIQRDYGVAINYYRLLKGKELEIEEIHGSWEKVYRISSFYVVQLIGVDSWV